VLLCCIFLVAVGERSARELAIALFVGLVVFQVLFGTGLFIAMWMSAPFFWLLVLLWPLALLALISPTLFVEPDAHLSPFRKAPL
jgi:hypothetical protein